MGIGQQFGKFLRVFSFLCIVVSSLAWAAPPPGSAGNPIKLFFVPSTDAKSMEDKSKVVQKYLETQTGLRFRVAIPTSYVAVVEAFGTNRADVAALNTFGYIMANEKYGAQARLTVVRYKEKTYKAQIIAKADGPIKKLEDLNGKKFAFVDPASASGYLLPAKMFLDKKVTPRETMFAFKHDNVVSMVYTGQVDGGATFYSPPSNGQIQDARRLVKAQYPDVEQKVKILELTQDIPNDPIVFRKDLPEDVKKKVIDGILSYMNSPEGKEVFYALYGVTEMVPSTDAEYDSVRAMMKALGQDASKLMKK